MMGIVSRLRAGIRNDIPVTNDKAWNPSLWQLISSQSKSGEVVTEGTALTLSAVWCAVSVISGTISTLPLHLLRKQGKNSIKVRENTLYRVLHDQFNPYMTAQIGREVMMAHVLTWGNAYAQIDTDGQGNIQSLWPIAPHRVNIVAQNGQIVYQICIDTGEIIYLPSRKVLHLYGLGYDGFQGYSVVGLARKNLGLAMAMETFGSLFFGNGTHPGIVVTHPGKLSEQGHQNLENSLQQAHSGLGQSHKLMLLEEAMKVEKIGLAPEDSQFLESRAFSVNDVARWFNLPPHKLKDLTRSSFSNIEQEQISFVVDSILPWLIRVEQIYNLQLLNDLEKLQGFYTRHNVDGIMRGNSNDRSTYYSKMFAIGAISINEIRATEGWNAFDNPYCDEPFIPVNNMVPISKIDEFLNRQVNPNSDRESSPESYNNGGTNDEK